MSGKSTTAKGDAFRDTLERVLSAAGFQTVPETKLGHKNIDVSAVWTRDSLVGEQRFAFEAKDYAGTLPGEECSKFASDHLPYLQNSAIDHTWLVSRGPISPGGRAVADTHPRLRIMTFTELQRQLLGIDSYLADLVEEHKASQLDRFYIRPETSAGEDLESFVQGWLRSDRAPPTFVLGAYGKGKSTFALHLAASMARKALEDPTARAPILVRLGEIADEQSIEGLLGKVLASQHRVANYHFNTFRALNEVGRFLLIYDGFDEMKHGLTPAKFQQVLAELMRLDEGDARILVLGRDTAFHDDAEFRAIIDGVQRTGAGREVATPGRRQYGHVELRGFTVEEARTFVANYLPVLAEKEGSGPSTDPAWITQRVAELSSGRFDQLLERPVHAQMLCRIAVQPDQLRPEMSVYELFDSFVHYLLSREVDKRGRDRSFPIDVRRRFNASLAWWLWEKGGASTTTLADIPQSLCDAAARDARHSLDREETRRELVQGCLIEKGVSTIYFHRSLQEFLAAEYLIENDLLSRTGPGWLGEVTSALTPEVIEFIVAGANVSTKRRTKALEWLGALRNADGHRISIQGFELFVQLARELNLAMDDPYESPWLVWLAFLQRTGARDFTHRGRNTFNVLADLIAGSRKRAVEAQAAAVYVLCRTLFHELPGEPFTPALAAMVPIASLAEAVQNAKVKKSERQIVRQDEDFLFWALLRSWHVERRIGEELGVTIDLTRLHHDAMTMLPGGFDRDVEEPRGKVSVPVQALYRGLATLKPAASESDLDKIRPFFNDPDARSKIAPLQVEHREASVRVAVPPPPVDRPKLTTKRRL